MSRLLAALLFFALPLVAVELAGFWEFEVDLGGIEMEANCDLMQLGGKLTGRCWADSGPFRYDVEAAGTANGDQIELSYSFPSDRGKATFLYKGKVAQDSTISGDFRLTTGEGSQPSKGVFAAAKRR
jgi:hypothetical protein